MRGCVATDSVATGSVATGSVATAFVALGGVATGCVPGSRVTDGSVAAAVPEGGSVAAGGFAVDGVLVDDVTLGRTERACRAETRGATGVPAAERASEESDGAVTVVVADGTVAPVGAPAELPPLTSGVIPTSTRAECHTGVGDAAFAGSAGVVTCAGCWPGVAEPLATGMLVGLDNPPGVVVAVVTPRRAREVRLESTAVRVWSTGPRVPVSDAELPLTSATEAPFDSVVEAIVAASAAFAQTPETSALAVAIRPKN